MRESIVKKAYYSIGDVCDLTGLKPHVLRYWETQFDFLRPTKNRAGNRVYRPKDIELVLLVKNLLYQQKYTIEGANQKLLEMRKEGGLEVEQHEVLGPEFLASMKRELSQLAKVLTPSEPLSDSVGGAEESDAADGPHEGDLPYPDDVPDSDEDLGSDNVLASDDAQGAEERMAPELQLNVENGTQPGQGGENAP